jgi:hypothetical protein
MEAKPHRESAKNAKRPTRCLDVGEPTHYRCESDASGERRMSLEHAVRRLTFDSAAAFGIYDRGLVQPGMEKGNHTGSYRGRVLRNARHQSAYA